MPHDEDYFAPIANDVTTLLVDVADSGVRAAWCSELRISDDDLRDAVQRVGAMPAAIRTFFAKPRPVGPSDAQKAAYETKRAARAPRRPRSKA